MNQVPDLNRFVRVTQTGRAGKRAGLIVATTDDTITVRAFNPVNPLADENIVLPRKEYEPNAEGAFWSWPPRN